MNTWRGTTAGPDATCTLHVAAHRPARQRAQFGTTYRLVCGIGWELNSTHSDADRESRDIAVAVGCWLWMSTSTSPYPVLFLLSSVLCLLSSASVPCIYLPTYVYTYVGTYQCTLHVSRPETVTSRAVSAFAAASQQLVALCRVAFLRRVEEPGLSNK